MAQTMRRKKIIIIESIVRQLGFYFYKVCLAKIFGEKEKKKDKEIEITY